MHTKDMLAEALRAVGLNEMAEKAATGYYHDFLSPLDLPEIVLCQHLAEEVRKHPDRTDISALRERVIDGDFDANEEESEAWAASPEGQAAFAALSKLPK
jgi:hypothetical protein